MVCLQIPWSIAQRYSLATLLHGGGSSRAREPNGWLPSARLCSGARLRCLLAKVSPLSTGSSEPGRESSALLCVCISLGTGRGELHAAKAGAGASTYLGLDAGRRSHLLPDLLFTFTGRFLLLCTINNRETDYPFNSSTRFLKILFIPLPLSLRLFIDTVESSL